MFTRAVLAAAGLAAVPAALSTVHAADMSNAVSASEKDATSGNKIFVHELPIYGEPPPAELVYIQEKPGMIQQNMKPVSDVVIAGLDYTKSAVTVFSDGQSTFSSTLLDFLKYLRDDSGIVPRAAFITVSGFGGLVAGYRGGILRKAIYASIGMASAASICYPDQAIDISKQAWILTKEQAKEFWRPARVPGSEGSAPKAENTKDKEMEGKTSAAQKDVKVAVGSSEAKTIQPKEDHGMSNPEDKDMYTTRSA